MTTMYLKPSKMSQVRVCSWMYVCFKKGPWSVQESVKSQRGPSCGSLGGSRRVSNTAPVHLHSTLPEIWDQTERTEIWKKNQSKQQKLLCVLIWARSTTAASLQTFTLKHLRIRKSVIQTVALIESTCCHLLFTFANRSVALTLRHSFALTLCCWPSLMSWSQPLFSSLGLRRLLVFLFQPCQRQQLLIWVDGRDVWQVESPCQPSGSRSDLAPPGPDDKASLRISGYNNVVQW